MNRKLLQSFKAFTAQNPAVASVQSRANLAADDERAMTFLSGIVDPHHSILIRSRLDQAHAPEGDPLRRDAWSPGSPATFAASQERWEAIRGEAAEKFSEFRDKWRKRLAFAQLFPFLQRNQWFEVKETGFALTGKGTRKEAKMLYLQTLHDMASDGERQVSSLSGQVFRLQEELAEMWRAEATGDGGLLPLLESALRAGETGLFKHIRLSLGDLALETFAGSVNRWEAKIYPTEADLFRNIAKPWDHPRYSSGFEGFMEAFADCAEALSQAMLEHYAGKWELLLRGFSSGWEENEIVRLETFTREILHVEDE